MEQKLPGILVIDNSPAFTGALKSITSIAGILRLQFNFIFCIPKSSIIFSWFIENDFRFERIPFIELRWGFKAILYPIYLVVNSFRLLSLIKKEKIEIIHVNDLYNMTGVVVKILHPKIKLVYHVRLLRSSYASLLYTFWIKLINRYADAIIACSFAVKSSSLLKFDRITVVYDSFNFSETHQSVLKSDDTIDLLYLANFISGKGHDKAIDAFLLAYRENKRLRLTLVGGDMGLRKNMEFKNALIGRVAKEKIGNVVVFNDFDRDVERVIKSAHIFLNFSESESFSMTCLEALVYGTPVIATDCGGPAELFENRKSGWLLPVNDINAMKDAILTLASNTAMREQFSTEGKLYALKKFNLGTSASRLADVYLNLLSDESFRGH